MSDRSLFLLCGAACAVLAVSLSSFDYQAWQLERARDNALPQAREACKPLVALANATGGNPDAITVETCARNMVRKLIK